jgi:peroxiredoxin
MMKKLFAGIIALCSIAYTSIAQDGYRIGSEVKDFELKNIDGQMVSLSSIPKAKGYIIVFTCNHCPYSRAYEDRIIQLHLNYSLQGYPVVAINSNDPKVSPEDSYKKMQERAKQKGFPFVYLYDETQAVAKQFGAARTPQVYLLRNTEGRNTVEYIGTIDNNWENYQLAEQKYVEQALKNIQEGKPVNVPETKAVGCTIKWKEKK